MSSKGGKQWILVRAVCTGFSFRAEMARSRNPHCPTACAITQPRAATFLEMTAWLWSSHSPSPEHPDFPDFISQNLEGTGKGGGSRAVLRDTFSSRRQQVWGERQEQEWALTKAGAVGHHRKQPLGLTVGPVKTETCLLSSFPIPQPGQRDHTSPSSEASKKGLPASPVQFGFHVIFFF